MLQFLLEKVLVKQNNKQKVAESCFKCRVLILSGSGSNICLKLQGVFKSKSSNSLLSECEHQK